MPLNDVRLSSQCTFWRREADDWCHAPADYVRFAADGVSVIDVLCHSHKTADARAIPPGTPRAPVTVRLGDLSK